MHRYIIYIYIYNIQYKDLGVSTTPSIFISTRSFFTSAVFSTATALPSLAAHAVLCQRPTARPAYIYIYESRKRGREEGRRGGGQIKTKEGREIGREGDREGGR